jgi:hypothetical protein
MVRLCCDDRPDPINVSSRSELNDVEIVFNAWKYSDGLITADGGSKRQRKGILGNSDQLEKLGIRIFRDFEAVDLVKQRIVDRDSEAKVMAATTGDPLPEWVGKDFDVLG